MRKTLLQKTLTHDYPSGGRGWGQDSIREDPLSHMAEEIAAFQSLPYPGAGPSFNKKDLQVHKSSYYPSFQFLVQTKYPQFLNQILCWSKEGISDTGKLEKLTEPFLSWPNISPRSKSNKGEFVVD